MKQKRKKENNIAVYINKDIHKGVLCIKDTNIPVFVVLEDLSKGYSTPEILKMYPTLREEDVYSVLKYASEDLKQPQNLNL